MKLTPRQLAGALARQLPPLLLIYGDDSGAVRQAAKQCLQATGVPLDDPFAADRLSVDDIVTDPGRLLSSAAQASFGGGLRLVSVEGATGAVDKPALDSLTEAVKTLLENLPADVAVVLPIPGLDAKHKLPKLVEKHTSAAAIRCFQDNARDVGQFAQETARQAGKRLHPAAQTYLQENLGADRDITLRELEKLLIYAADADEITLEDCLAVTAGAPAVNVFKLCDAVGARDRTTTDRMLHVLVEEGEDLNMVFMLVVRHLRRLLRVKEALAAGESENAALRALQPPVLFGQPEFLAQVHRYPLPRLQNLAAYAFETLKNARSGVVPETLVFTRAILSLSY